MVAYVFDTLLAKGVRAGEIPARTQQSRDWFRNEAEKVTVSPSSLVRTSDNIIRSNEPGRMVLFQYDPKHKKTLPYYDTFPLIFNVGPAEGGFYGINMHYLPLRERAMLMDSLYSLTTDKRYDSNTKLKIAYDVLKSSSRFKLFRPCFKHYLSSFVKSRKILIEPVEWDIALFLPLQRFKKADADKVYEDSLRKVRNAVQSQRV
jgi:hypothetical protein